MNLIWYNRTTDPMTNIVVQQYTRHILGAKDSPTCANYATQGTEESIHVLGFKWDHNNDTLVVGRVSTASSQQHHLEV